VLATLAGGVVLIGAFVAWELRTEHPMLPMSFFARRSFLVTNLASLAMYFGMFGSIFFLTQYLQIVLGNSPLQAGLKLLVWTGTTMIVAPLAGVFSARYGSRPFLAAGLALQATALAWLASLATTTTSYGSVLIPFVLAGGGMALFFAPAAGAVLEAVRPDQAGQASGATNTIRELGGVLGVAVLASVFSSAGSYTSGTNFVNGLVPALWVGVVVLGVFALIVAAVPWGPRVPAVAQAPGARDAATAGT
jgi:predicted MFS family arabinose efflux permease